jgi:hypothetical protein
MSAASQVAREARFIQQPRWLHCIGGSDTVSRGEGSRRRAPRVALRLRQDGFDCRRDPGEALLNASEAEGDVFERVRCPFVG